MIGSYLRFLLPLALTILGVLTMALGALVTPLLYEDVPARTALIKVSGTLDRYDELRHYRSRRPEDQEGYIHRYRLQIDSADGQRVKLTVPAGEINEQRVKSLLGQPVVALYSSSPGSFWEDPCAWEPSNTGCVWKNPGTGFAWEDRGSAGQVWELSSSTTRIIEYERARQQRRDLIGPSIAGGGLLMSLLSGLWVLRRRRTAATA